jgi:hypothetical protein
MHLYKPLFIFLNLYIYPYTPIYIIIPLYISLYLRIYPYTIIHLYIPLYIYTLIANTSNKTASVPTHTEERIPAHSRVVELLEPTRIRHIHATLPIALHPTVTHRQVTRALISYTLIHLYLFMYSLIYL